MGDFVAAALSFPAVLFTFLLLVVIGYWVAVLIGSLDTDSLDFDDAAGALGALGLGGVPVAVVLSVLIALSWFFSLVGGVLLGGALFAVVVLLGALAAAWLCARLLVLGLRRVLPAGAEPSRVDFVGKLCVIRTGRVDADFGQAEVTAADGSSAVIQVRQPGNDPLAAGDSALIFDFDAEREFFWVTPVDAALRPPPQKDR